MPSSTKLTYAASAAVTFTSLASLASSASLTAGAESNAVDNTTNLYLDYEVSVVAKANTSAPTAGGYIEVWIVPLIDDTPTWPDVFDGTDSAETVTSRDILAACGRLAATVTNDATASRIYTLTVGSVAQLFGGICPAKFAIFLTQSTGLALAA
jgi:hypothetical protein